jgi:transcriptional regulator with XRE-family HTH domain
MTLHKAPSVPDVSLLAHVKTLSGRRIEEARRRERITQEEFARAVGVGVRWLREIEGGNPSSRLEDHLQCAHHLKLSTGHILLPLLFMGYDMTFPFQLAHGDLRELERRCIDLIAEQNIAQLTRQLTPRWWTNGPGRAG